MQPLTLEMAHVVIIVHSMYVIIFQRLSNDSVHHPHLQDQCHPAVVALMVKDSLPQGWTDCFLEANQVCIQRPEKLSRLLLLMVL